MAAMHLEQAQRFILAKKSFGVMGTLSICICTSIRCPTLHTNRERRELKKLQKKFLVNVSVGILSCVFIWSRSKVEKKKQTIIMTLLPRDLSDNFSPHNFFLVASFER